MDLVVRAAVIFFFVFVLTRVLGRRELSSLEPFDIILLVVIGDLVQQGITQSDDSVTGTLIVLSTIALLTVGVSYVNFRVRRLRPLLEGEPLVLVEDGRVDRAAPRARAHHDRRPHGSGSAAEPRLARRRALGGARDERPDQLHPEEVMTQRRSVTEALVVLDVITTFEHDDGDRLARVDAGLCTCARARARARTRAHRRVSTSTTRRATGTATRPATSSVRLRERAATSCAT